MAPNSHTVRTTRRRLHALDAAASLDVEVGTLDEHLPALARLIEERAFAADSDPQIIRITRDGLTDDGIEIGTRLIDEIDGSVVDALTGFTAPPDWLAIGVSTGGNAYPIDDGRETRRRARVVHLVTRAGSAASVVRVAGDEPQLMVSSGDDATMVGRVDDVCRRALCLPTAPAASSLEFWALVWLERLVASGTSATPTTWEAVAAQHAAAAVFVEEDPGRAAEVTDDRAHFGRLMAAIESWPALRNACSAGSFTFDGVPAGVARWLDDGAFSRWVMGSYPPLDQLVTAVCELLAPPLASRLRAVLHEWGLDER